MSPSHRYGSLVKASMAKPALPKTSGRLFTCSSQVCPLISKTSEGFSHLPPTEKTKEFCLNYKENFVVCCLFLQKAYYTDYIPFHSKQQADKRFVELLEDQFKALPVAQEPHSSVTCLTSSPNTGWKVTSMSEAGVQQTWTDRQFNAGLFWHYKILSLCSLSGQR